MLRLFVKDNTNGNIHEYGTSPHDALILQKDGSLHYENLQCFGSTKYPEEGYSFCLYQGTVPPLDDPENDPYIDIAGEYYAKPQTNADRIRAMSDEELAKFIGEEGFHCEICAKGVNSECDLKCGTYCLDWLKQPAEETEPFLFEKGNQPHGAEQFARACGVCVNHKSELCRDCKTEKKSGFEPPF